MAKKLNIKIRLCPCGKPLNDKPTSRIGGVLCHLSCVQKWYAERQKAMEETAARKEAELKKLQPRELKSGEMLQEGELPKDSPIVSNKPIPVKELGKE